MQPSFNDTAAPHTRRADSDSATPLGKRVQANLGAKNHAVIMPDGQYNASLVTALPAAAASGAVRVIAYFLANKNLALNAVAGAAFGAAGQRCMALSVGMSLHPKAPSTRRRTMAVFDSPIRRLARVK